MTSSLRIGTAITISFTGSYIYSTGRIVGVMSLENLKAFYQSKYKDDFFYKSMHKDIAIGKSTT